VFAGGVETGVGQRQSLDWLSAQDVRLDNLIDIVQRHPAIPDRIGIDHEVGAVLALIEAAGLVGPYLSLESARRKLFLECLLQFRLACWIAAGARGPGGALVAADEDMLLELGHCKNVSDLGSSCWGAAGFWLLARTWKTAA